MYNQVESSLFLFYSKRWKHKIEKWLCHICETKYILLQKIHFLFVREQFSKRNASVSTELCGSRLNIIMKKYTKNKYNCSFSCQECKSQLFFYTNRRTNNVSDKLKYKTLLRSIDYNYNYQNSRLCSHAW